MREPYGNYTLASFSGCCGSGGVGIENPGKETVSPRE
jgi:hypothetical protein